MGVKSSIIIFNQLADRTKLIFKDKSRRYGNSWWDDEESFRIISPYIYLRSKARRLHELLWRNRYADKAACVETLMDTAVYSLITAALIEDTMNQKDFDKLERLLIA